MPILTKEVEVKPTGKMVKYYRNLGYDVKYNQPLLVKIEHLQMGSHANIEILCDMCNKNKMTVTYDTYNRVVENTGSYVCKECLGKKRNDTNLKRYGTNYPSQLKIFKEKTKQTNLKKYGVENVMMDFEIKKRLKQTIFQKYGVSSTMQLPKVREKANETLCKNGTQKTSKQQLYLHSILGGKLNFPISYYAIDICFPEEKLTLEYDGGFHDGRVKLGRLTQEEFNQKEIIRNNIIKREGYKQMRIISSKDRLPQDDILLQMLQDAKQYFSDYPNHSWIEFSIDTSTVRNAEHKEGVPYDFGELRTIKDKDIENIKEDLTEIA